MINNRDESRYKKWESEHEERGTSDLIPAATVVIMRDSKSGIELLIKSVISFEVKAINIYNTTDYLYYINQVNLI